MLPMDVRLASTSAKFGFVFARRGIVPEGASSWFLPRIVGISTALEWCYSGRFVSAWEAQASGLVKGVYAPPDLLPAARSLAASFMDCTSPVSVTLIRQMLWRMLTAPHPMDAHVVDSRAMYLLGRTPDVKEGVMSFLEKRAPTFTSRVSADTPELFEHWAQRDY